MFAQLIEHLTHKECHKCVARHRGSICDTPEHRVALLAVILLTFVVLLFMGRWLVDWVRSKWAMSHSHFGNFGYFRSASLLFLFQMFRTGQLA